MTDKELRRLSRSELLEMLIAQIEENDRLKTRLGQAEAQLRDRRITIDKAGSLAEAALALNGVFQAADTAAQQYQENIRQEAQAYSQKVHAEADAYWERIVAKTAELPEDQEALREMIRSTGDAG